MEINIVQPFLLGLSSGIFCLAYCLPFVAPFMVLEKRVAKGNLAVIFKFILGRLTGYLIFGAFFGFLGQTINNKTIDLLMVFSLMALAMVLILYAVGMIREQKGFCLVPAVKNGAPLVMGFLMGINICPPFLMSLAYVFTQHNWLAGIIYFSIFFVATSLYFLPLIFIGLLNKMNEFRILARISAIVVGLMFLAYGFYYIINY